VGVFYNHEVIQKYYKKIDFSEIKFSIFNTFIYFRLSMNIKNYIRYIIIFIVYFLVCSWEIYATNWQCGSIVTLPLPSNNSHPWTSYFFCSQGETDWISFDTISKERSWSCKWTAWDPDAICSYNTNINIIETTATCGTSNNQWFSTTNNILGDFYSNSNNKFLWKLCKDSSNNNI
jgi:hypothetical protein